MIGMILFVPDVQNSPDAYACDPLAFLELSTLNYPFYLINLQVVHSDDQSQSIGKLKSFEFVVRIVLSSSIPFHLIFYRESIKLKVLLKFGTH